MKPYIDKNGWQWYGCGHTHKGVIITDSNPLTISAWLDWKDSVGYEGDKSECFNCYGKSNTEVQDSKKEAK